jgi:hypothetical protein
MPAIEMWYETISPDQILQSSAIDSHIEATQHSRKGDVHLTPRETDTQAASRSVAECYEPLI